MEPYPLKFEDLFLEKIWGGDALRRRLNKALPAGKKIGESWELSAHSNGVSRIKNGPLKGKPITEIIPGFPLLFKFIDANDRLSVQVHPVDAPARKTEAWHIVHAEPGARMICGLKKGAALSDLRESLRNNSLKPALHFNEFGIKSGDTVFVPPGTVHAIMEGTLLYEVQETSDVTYRLFDWERTDEKGKARPLHVEQSLEVLKADDGRDHRTAPVELPMENGVRFMLAACPCFVLEKIVLSGREDFPHGRGFEVLSVLSGNGNVYYKKGRETLSPGETVLLPAGLGPYALEPAEGGLTTLLSWAPPSGRKVREVLLEEGVGPEAIQGLGGVS